MAAVRTVTAAEYVEAGLMFRMPRPATPLAPRGWKILSIGHSAEGGVDVRWSTPEGEVTRTYAPTDTFKVRF